MRFPNTVMAEITIKSLNEAIARGALTVAEDEAFYERQVGGVADRITEQGIKVLLLAGPSGAGKTTTANLIFFIETSQAFLFTHKVVKLSRIFSCIITQTAVNYLKY